MPTSLKILAFVVPFVFLVLLYLTFISASRDEACVAAYRPGDPLSAYCSRLFE